jgi:hypothetical protein
MRVGSHQVERRPTVPQENPPSRSLLRAVAFDERVRTADREGTLPEKEMPSKCMKLKTGLLQKAVSKQAEASKIAKSIRPARSPQFQRGFNDRDGTSIECLPHTPMRDCAFHQTRSTGVFTRALSAPAS